MRRAFRGTVVALVAAAATGCSTGTSPVSSGATPTAAATSAGSVSPTPATSLSSGSELPVPPLAAKPDTAAPGQVITISGPSCSGAVLSFHDSYNWTGAGKYTDTGLRVVPFQAAGGQVVARYQVRRDDSPGKGVFVLSCGGLAGNPSVVVTILR